MDWDLILDAIVVIALVAFILGLRHSRKRMGEGEKQLDAALAEYLLLREATDTKPPTDKGGQTCSQERPYISP